MKILLIFFVLLFSSSVLADDISDFQIEGMSIGDSLLDYFSENEIKKNTYYGDFPHLGTKFVTVEIKDANFYKIYNAVQMHILKNDKNYIIYSLQGLLFDDFKNCTKNKDEIGKDLSIIFKNIKKDSFYNNKLDYDSTGKSTYSGIYFEFPSGAIAGTYCYDWSSKEAPEYKDHLRVGLFSYEFEQWLQKDSNK